MRSHKGTERSASRRWLRITFACLGLIAVFVGTASALTVEYTISTYAATSGTGTGSCVSGIFVTSCGFFGYSNSDLPPSVGFPPLPSLTFGVDNPVEQTAIAKQFPAMVASGAFADFAVLFGRSLLTAYATSDGGNSVRNEIPSGDGGTIIVQLSADSFASVAARLSDTLVFDIPAAYDGQRVFGIVNVPVHALGDGASSGVVSANVTGLEFDQGLAAFGHRGFFSETTYEEDSSIDLRVLIRREGSTERTVYAPFSLFAEFESAPGSGWGAGFVDARSTIGLRVSSEPGVVIRSLSGDLDALLALPASVPAPSSLMLIASVTIAIAIWLAWRKIVEQASP